MVDNILAHDLFFGGGGGKFSATDTGMDFLCFWRIEKETSNVLTANGCITSIAKFWALVWTLGSGQA